MTPHPAKQCRRTATAVMAGAFDRRPQRDVLTSLLNVGPDNYDDEEEENLVEASSSKLPTKDSFWRERRDSGKRKGKDRATEERPRHTSFSKSATPIARMTPLVATQPLASTSYTSRPSINVVRSGRAASRTPSVSPESTPGPSDSSSISRTSSKRPRTPRDDEDFPMPLPKPVPHARFRKPRERAGRAGSRSMLRSLRLQRGSLISTRLSSSASVHSAVARSSTASRAVPTGRMKWLL
ncbi:hypothetical protein BDZ89DRAFT_1059512, partial [Hymenopellis radicata]